MAFSLNPRSTTASKGLCLCHKAGVQGPLTNFSEVSWRTFKEASDLRKDDISESMKGKWENGPFGMYHRNCYQSYTAKNVLDRVAKKRKIEEISSGDNTSPIELQADPRPTRSSLLATDMRKCAICQTEKTDPKDRRREEKLTTCETMQAGRTLLEAAKVRGDQRLIVSLSDQDPIAIELRYHRTCYRMYTNTKQIEVIQKNQEGKLESLYDNAFQALKSEMEPKIFESLEVLRMSDLRERYVELLSFQGVQNPLYRSEKLKVRMQKAYHGRISFWHPRYRSEAEIVYCDEVSKGQIVECGLNRSVENDKFLKAPEDVPLKNYVYHAAKTVRAALLSQELNMPWPPYQTTINEENISVPIVVYNLLAWILCENGEGEDERAKGKDEDTQTRCLTYSNWVNPFLQSDTDELCHIASGMTASKKVEEDLCTAHDKGKEAMTAFIRKRLTTNEISFHDPIPKLKLATFDSMPVSSVKIGGKEVMLKADRDLFARLLVVAQT